MTVVQSPTPRQRNLYEDDPYQRKLGYKYPALGCQWSSGLQSPTQYYLPYSLGSTGYTPYRLPGGILDAEFAPLSDSAYDSFSSSKDVDLAAQLYSAQDFSDWNGLFGWNSSLIPSEYDLTSSNKKGCGQFYSVPCYELSDPSRNSSVEAPSIDSGLEDQETASLDETICITDNIQSDLQSTNNAYQQKLANSGETRMDFLCSFDDTLFSSMHELGTNLGVLCGLCSELFNLEDEDQVVQHTNRHVREFCEGDLQHRCDVCFVNFTHLADLKWHLKCAERGDCGFDFLHNETCTGHHPPDPVVESYRGRDNFQFCTQVRHWEQAQLRHFSSLLECVRGGIHRSKNKPRRQRSCSVPAGFSPRYGRTTRLAESANECIKPRKARLPTKSQRMSSADAYLDSNQHTQPQSTSTTVRRYSENSIKAFSEPRVSYNDLRHTIHDLQKRVINLKHKVMPLDEWSPGSQVVRSIETWGPGFGSRQLHNNELGGLMDKLRQVIQRSKSEPPVRHKKSPDAWPSEVITNVNPGEYSSHKPSPNSRSLQSGQKHGRTGRSLNDQYDGDGDINGDEDDDGNCQRKRSRTEQKSNEDPKRKFPCVFFVGEPERFSQDSKKHEYISNMCRHMHSHGFYVCSTCILRFPSLEELDSHNLSHIRSCSRKGCKRQKPAAAAESSECDHILSAEQQWKAIFTLRYGRTPPEALPTTPQSIDIFLGNARSNVRDMPEDSDPSPSTNDDQRMFDDFFDYPMLGTSSLDVCPTTNHNLSFDDILGEQKLTEGPSDSRLARRKSFELLPFDEEQRPPQGADGKLAPSFLQRAVESLEQQVLSLEKQQVTRASDDREMIFSLQGRIASLEQKLFQSSQREDQLESALEVIFDAFQATGAPQAQPNRPLWNLVKSHLSKISGLAEASQSGIQQQTPTPNSSPAFAHLSLQSGKDKPPAPLPPLTPSNSATGSFR